MKTALLVGVNKRKPADGSTSLGVICYNPVGHKMRFTPELGFERWECELHHNSLGLQERHLPDGLGLRITPLSGEVMVTLTDEGTERDFLLDKRSIKQYRELFA